MYVYVNEQVALGENDRQFGETFRIFGVYRQHYRKDRLLSNIDLAGRRILVVEDDALLAISIADEIENHAGIVIGPV